MKTIYNKILGDPDYDSNKLEVNDEVSILLQQIEMLLFTRKNTVLGYPTMGIDLENMLYALNASMGTIRNTIYNQISAYCPLASKHKVIVDVKIYRGTNRDIGVIDIIVEDKRTGIIVT